jgi:hypothetical protein
LYLIAFDADGTAGDGEVRVALSLAGANIELPSVPWTGHDISGEMTFADRSSRVRAGIVDCEKRTAHIEQGDPDSIHLDRLSGSRWNIFRRGDGHEFRHISSRMIVRTPDIDSAEWPGA